MSANTLYNTEIVIYNYEIWFWNTTYIDIIIISNKYQKNGDFKISIIDILFFSSNLIQFICFLIYLIPYLYFIIIILIILYLY